MPGLEASKWSGASWPPREEAKRSSGKSYSIWHLIDVDISNDLTDERGRPKWVFSSYSPGRNVPASLLPDNELSPEELRFRFYEQAALGNAEQANEEALQGYEKCVRDMNEVRSNIGKIKDFLESKEKEHPNRYDLCKIDGKKSIRDISEEIKATSQTKNSFEKGPASGFGKPAFGQSTNSAAFGQPAPTTSNFGRPAVGQPAPSSAFGRPNFGAPALGSTAQPSNSFGQPSTGGFGSSGFGQAAQTSSAFGKPPLAGPSTTFGQPAPSFGQQQPAFGQAPAQGTGFGRAATQSSPFSQPAATGTGAFGKPAFGQTTTEQKTPFAQPLPVQNGVFGRQGFAQASANNVNSTISGFGSTASTQPSQGNNTFGAKSDTAAAGGKSFGAPSSGTPSMMDFASSTSSSGAKSPLAGTSKAPIHPTQRLPPMSSSNTKYIGSGSNRKLTMYRGRSVKMINDRPCYDRPDGKGYERVWFPEGNQTEGIRMEASTSLLPKDTEAEPEKYTSDVEDSYKRLYQTGNFEAKMLVPEVPPKREWGEFDF